MEKYYKWTAGNRPIYGDGVYNFDFPQPRIDDKIKPHEIGYHYVTREQLAYVVGTELWEIDPVEPPEIADQYTCVGRTFRFVRRLRWSMSDLLAFVHACQTRVAMARMDERRESGDAAKRARRAVVCQSTAILTSTCRWPQPLAQQANNVGHAAATAAIYFFPRSAGHDHMDVYAAERKWQADWIVARLRDNGEDI